MCSFCFSILFPIVLFSLPVHVNSWMFVCLFYLVFPSDHDVYSLPRKLIPSQDTLSQYFWGKCNAWFEIILAVYVFSVPLLYLHHPSRKYAYSAIWCATYRDRLCFPKYLWHLVLSCCSLEGLCPLFFALSGFVVFLSTSNSMTFSMTFSSSTLSLTVMQENFQNYP